MPTTAQEIYIQVVRTLSLTQRLRLATLILNELSLPNLAVVEPSDTWTEEDCLDVTTFSLQYAASIVHSDPEILGGTPVFGATGIPMKILLDCLEGSDSPCGVFRPFS
jgi:hypothetical protein